MGELMAMSGKEIHRLKVLRQVSDRVLTERQAGLSLGLSNRRLDPAFREAILARVRERYGDFGPTLAAEYLRGEVRLVSKEALRHWMIAEGLWPASRGRRTRLHPPRPRRPRRGGTGANRWQPPRRVRGTGTPLQPDRLHRRCHPPGPRGPFRPGGNEPGRSLGPRGPCHGPRLPSGPPERPPQHFHPV